MDKFELANRNEVYTSELIIKKSKFIAKVFYVDNVDKADEIIEKCRQEYKDARHVVYAYRLKSTGKFTDDKEPQGTAGKPIYSILEKEELINILVIVVRYFGGILLGAGPLTRAYGTSAKQALELAEKKKYIEYEEKEIECEYKEEEILKRKLQNSNCIINEINRTDKVNIKYLEPRTT